MISVKKSIFGCKCYRDVYSTNIWKCTKQDYSLPHSSANLDAWMTFHVFLLTMALHQA